MGLVEISKASDLCFWRNILKLEKESTRWAQHLLNEEQKCVHVRTEHKLLKRYPRYDQKIFMNVVVGDESWIHCIPIFFTIKGLASRFLYPKARQLMQGFKEFLATLLSSLIARRWVRLQTL